MGAELKLRAAVRQAWIDYGRSLTAELAALQKIQNAREAYYKNADGMDLPDKVRALGSPDDPLSNIITQARALETLFGAEDFAKMGLPAYNKITLRGKP